MTRERYCGVVAQRLSIGCGFVVQPLVRKEEKQLILFNGPAQAGRVLAIIILHANRRSIIWTAPLVICVEIRILIEEDTASVELYRFRSWWWS